MRGYDPRRIKELQEAALRALGSHDSNKPRAREEARDMVLESAPAFLAELERLQRIVHNVTGALLDTDVVPRREG